MLPKVRRYFHKNTDLLVAGAAYDNVVPARSGLTTFITQITLSITTHFATSVVVWDDDGAGPPIAAYTDFAAAAGSPWCIVWNFGDFGTPVTAGANVDIAITNVGIIGKSHIEGYYI